MKKCSLIFRSSSLMIDNYRPSLLELVAVTSQSFREIGVKNYSPNEKFCDCRKWWMIVTSPTVVEHIWGLVWYTNTKSRQCFLIIRLFESLCRQITCYIILIFSCSLLKESLNFCAHERAFLHSKFLLECNYLIISMSLKSN